MPKNFIQLAATIFFAVSSLLTSCAQSNFRSELSYKKVYISNDLQTIYQIICKHHYILFFNNITQQSMAKDETYDYILLSYELKANAPMRVDIKPILSKKKNFLNETEIDSLYYSILKKRKSQNDSIYFKRDFSYNIKSNAENNKILFSKETDSILGISHSGRSTKLGYQIYEKSLNKITNDTLYFSKSDKKQIFKFKTYNKTFFDIVRDVDNQYLILIDNEFNSIYSYLLDDKNQSLSFLDSISITGVPKEKIQKVIRESFIKRPYRFKIDQNKLEMILIDISLISNYPLPETIYKCGFNKCYADSVPIQTIFSKLK